MNILHMATISHRHGENLYFAKSPAGLFVQIFAYVSQNWADEMPEDIEMPEDEEKAVDMYFDTIAENLGDESITYNEVNLDTVTP